MRKSDYDFASGPETYILPLIKYNIREAIKDLPNAPILDILDAGCGNQPFKDLILSGNNKYWSLDYEQNESQSVDFIGDLNHPIEIDRQFDAILCTEVLEHIYDWKSAFSNFHGLLKKGGRLIITTPFFFNIHESPNDFWRPTMFALSKFLESNGFNIITQKQLGDAWDVLGTFANSIYLKNRNQSIKTSLLFRIAFFIQKKLRNQKAVVRIKKDIGIESNFYLSNFLVAIKK